MNFSGLKRILSIRSRSEFSKFYDEFEHELAVLFFVGGFLFDVLTLSRIDDSFTLIQQAVYILIIASTLAVDHIHREEKETWRLWGMQIWQYHGLAIHFLFGSLLSVYTLFFFKSASLATSFLFLLALISLMVINEIPRFQKLGPVLKFALLSLCLTCFFSYLFPIFLGFVGGLPFALSVLTSLGFSIGLARLINKRTSDPEGVRNLVVLPAAVVQIAFILLYALKAIPPVPLAVNFIGIYHSIQKEDGRYLLNYDRPAWKFWQSGAQTFKARPGDKIFCYARVFSPTAFKDQLKVRWLYKEPSGWRAYDAIPLQVIGGREEGFRGYTAKSNYAPGEWRVQIETSDEREIGRISFEVIADNSTDERAFRQDSD